VREFARALFFRAYRQLLHWQFGQGHLQFQSFPASIALSGCEQFHFSKSSLQELRWQLCDAVRSMTG
jgi:hypothetical protein